MELYRTTFPIEPSADKLSYQSSAQFIGSCFSEYIGERCASYKFRIDNNPFGIMYNPLSIKTGILRLIENRPYTKDELFHHADVWGSFDHHSRFSEILPEKTLENINQRLSFSADFLRKADFLFLTFGTSYVYYLKSTHKLVSNCHKFPASQFLRRRLDTGEIVQEYLQLMDAIVKINPKIRIVFTVSPIRHWKDGAHENQLSKSILLLAIDKLCNMFEQLFYFPSYELVMDDLRDYRFYEGDMLHPNQTAINYIWGHFKDCFIDKTIYNAMNEVEKVIQASKHRPFNPKSDAHISFVRKTLAQIELLKLQYNLDFTEQEELFLNYL